MNIHITSISAFPTDGELKELNKFINSHQIISVEKHFVSSPENSFWSFCIKYVNTVLSAQTKTSKKPIIDYREVLDAETFAKFSQLREKRKEVAELEGVPVYAIFNNKELAGLAQLEKITQETMLSVKGIGNGKVEKYLKSFSEIF